MSWIESFDRFLFLLINRDLSHPWLDVFFTTVTQKTFWIIPGLAAAAIFIYFRRKTALLAIGLALLTVAISDPLCFWGLKPFFGRLRPCHPDVMIEGGRFLMGMKTSLSLPSNHSMNVFAQAGLWSFLFPSKTAWFVGGAGIIAYSRVYVGVHYPGDVLLGAVLGFALGAGVFCGYSAIRAVWNRMKVRNSAMETTDESR